MHRPIALLLVSLIAIGCQSGDEEPPETFLLLPEADINVITGVAWEGTARITGCNSDYLALGDYTESRCLMIQNFENLAFADIPRNLRLTLSLWENNNIEGWMHTYITHYDGVPYDFTIPVNGTTAVGSGKDTALSLTPEAASVTANGEPTENKQYILRLGSFTAEEEELTMPGNMQLLLNKDGITETVVIDYSFILKKKY